MRCALRMGAAALAALPLLGCESKPDVVGPGEAPPAASGKPLDRLEPGELASGKVKVFGFVAPESMRLERKFPDAAHLVGQVKPEAVANYVRKQVQVEHVEIGAARTVFPKVTINGGDPARVYRIEVAADGPDTRLVLLDVTPPPTVQGLSEEERWKRAGFGPDGTQLQRDKVQ